MKTLKKISLTTALGSALLLGACGGDSDVVSSPGVAIAPGGPGGVTLPAPGPPVPASAGTSVSLVMAYLAGLSTTGEKAEPSPIADSFAVPDNETSDPQALS